jgi:hypothetical protein
MDAGVRGEMKEKTSVNTKYLLTPEAKIKPLFLRL